jgi:hypothetical protein
MADINKKKNYDIVKNENYDLIVKFNNESIKLLPCPFCGHDGIIKMENPVFNGGRNYFYATCSNDIHNDENPCILENIMEQDEQGGVSLNFSDPMDAVNLWNKRI